VSVLLPVTSYRLAGTGPVECEGCPESICLFWISREWVTCPWCNLAASQRRPYCPSMNSHFPVGLVSWQWDAVDWACVLCWPSYSRITSLSMEILASGKSRSRSETNLGWQTWVMWCFARKASTRAVEWAGILLWWSWSAHTVTRYTRSVSGVSLPTY